MPTSKVLTRLLFGLRLFVLVNNFSVISERFPGVYNDICYFYQTDRVSIQFQLKLSGAQLGQNECFVMIYLKNGVHFTVSTFSKGFAICLTFKCLKSTCDSTTCQVE